MPDDSTEKLRLREAERRLAASEIDDEVIRIRGYDSRTNVAVLRRLDYSSDQRQTRHLAVRIREQAAEEVGFEPTEPRNGSPVFETGTSLQQSDNCQGVTPNLPLSSYESSYALDHELAEILASWHGLPDHVRSVIVTLVRASRTEVTP